MALTKNKARLIKLVIGVFIMFVGGVICPTWGAVTRLGVQAIFIFAGMIFLAINNFTFVFTATAAMLAMQLTGFFTGAEIIAGSWGGSTIYQLILVYALCQGLVECGAGDVIARFLVSRKWAQGKPIAFTFMLLMASIFAGAFLSLGGIVFYYSVLDEIRKHLDYEVDSPWMKFNVFGIYMAACIGMTLIPYKGIPLIVFGSLNTMLAEFGYEINYVVYMAAIAIFGIVACLIYCLLMKFVFRVDMGKLSSFDIRKLEGMSSIRMNKHQALVSIIFAISILYGVAVVFVPKETAFGAFFNGITQTTWFAVCLGILCVVQVDGKPAINPRTAFKNGVQWDLLFSLAGFSLLGTMLSSADSGIQEWIRSAFGSILGQMSFPLFFLIIILFTLVFTNFMSNAAIGMIAAALAVPFLTVYVEQSGINLTMFAAGMMMADMYAFLTPAACGAAPLLHSHDSMVKDKRFIYTTGVLVCLIHTAVLWLMFTAAAYIF